ncbi:MAG TPA: hypothetical protein PK286_07480 [Devosia sp.]|nr:hypothetical protein [Devosia sp.]
MLTGFFRTIVLAALLLPLAACTGGPQQPSDTVDDQGNPPSTSSKPAAVRPPANKPANVPEASLAALAGGWAGDTASCAAPGPPVKLSTTQFVTIERTCGIADAIPDGQGGLTIGLRCAGPTGDEDAQLVKLLPTGKGIDLTVVGGDSGTQSLVRCP